MNNSKKVDNNTVTLIQYNNLKTELNNQISVLNKLIVDLSKKKNTCDKDAKDKTIQLAKLTADKTKLEDSVKDLKNMINFLDSENRATHSKFESLGSSYRSLSANCAADSKAVKELNFTLQQKENELHEKDILLSWANAGEKQWRNKYDRLYTEANEISKEAVKLKNGYDVRTIALQDVTKDNIDSPSKCVDYVEKLFRDNNKECESTVKREKIEHEEKIMKLLFDYDPAFIFNYLNRPQPVTTTKSNELIYELTPNVTPELTNTIVVNPAVTPTVVPAVTPTVVPAVTPTVVPYNMGNQLETGDEISRPMDTVTYTKQPTKTVEGLAYGPQYDVNGNLIQYDRYGRRVQYSQPLSNFTGLLFMFVFAVCFISAMYLSVKRTAAELEMTKLNASTAANNLAAATQSNKVLS
jgi:hypothetical protein